MAAPAFTLSGGDYEHVLALGPGDARFAYRHVASAALSGPVVRGEAFDATELSLASHVMLHAAGRRLPAIPVFPSRAFRNAAIFVRQDSALACPADLAGKRVGVGEFAMTPAIWTRGHLRDDHGLDPASVRWTVAPGQRFPVPAGFHAEERGGDLEALLAAGELDALIAGRPKDAQRPPAERRLRCLFADPAGEERGYFARTGIFPILHTVVLHERWAENPTLPRHLFDAYVAARRAAVTRRLSAGFLPFVERDWDVLTGAGGDPTRYGLTPPNRAAVTTLVRYLREQGLIDREPAVEDLFVAGSDAWADT